MAKAKAARRSRDPDANDKNVALIRDIRLLGRLLGEMIREQEGEAAFALIERIRQLSVAFRLKRDASAGTALDKLLNTLSDEQALSVIRAFSYFSHLANTAEDRHLVRRREEHERQGRVREGALEMTFRQLAAQRIDGA